MSTLKDLENAILEGEDDDAEALTKRAVNEGAKPMEVIDAMKNGLTVAGKRLEQKEYFIADLMMVGEAAKKSLNIVLPELEKSGNADFIATIVLGVVRGDVHDIGKNLVGAFLRGAGFKVIDLGSDVYPEKFVEAIKKYNPELIGASAYSTSTADIELPAIEKALTEAGVRDKVKYIIGGAGAYRDMLIQYNADGFGRDAADAVRECKRLIGAV
ncbi:B12-binding domain-containing protein [Candidatus Borrarchaeum sp.]|uniref:cobalamin B12-binding domain-containing protein n=1 Tax=Candidatus Borrarchaeum sp. TaxID=2846742 RepID=UPI00257E55F7|nr:cobalamin-dependent protein [Candidatus Borrarchaeum sp.]